MCVCSLGGYLYLIAALGWPPIHQSKDIQSHVVLAASPQREPKTRGTPLQIHAVEFGLILTNRQKNEQQIFCIVCVCERKTQRERESGCEQVLSFLFILIILFLLSSYKQRWLKHCGLQSVDTYVLPCPSCGHCVFQAFSFSRAVATDNKHMNKMSR